jgi:hypothetical protein
VALISCAPSPDQATAPTPAIDSVDIIFVGQNIITMDESDVTGVAVKGDRISFVGSAEDAMAFKGTPTLSMLMATFPRLLVGSMHWIYLPRRWVT